MKDKPKLTLVSDNPDLNTYYIPFTSIEVDIHPVKARSYDEALIKAGDGKMEKIVRRVKLEETRSNDVYMNPDMDTATLFARQIDHFELDIKDYDYPIPLT